MPREKNCYTHNNNRSSSQCPLLDQRVLSQLAPAANSAHYLSNPPPPPRT